MTSQKATLGWAALLVAGTPLWSWLITRSPEPASVEAAAAAGFALGLLPLGALGAVLLLGRLSRCPLALLMAAGLLLGIASSAAGFLFLASPAKALAALAFGRLLGREVPRASWLVIAVTVAFLVDIWSVFAGPTRAVVERAPGALDYLVVHFPGLGLEGAATGLGMSDFVFLGLLTAGAAVTRLRPAATLAGGLASFVLTLVIALVTDRPLPALPLLCAAFLVVNADLLLRRPRAR